MNKLFVSLIVGITVTACHGMDNVAKAAQIFDQEQDYFLNNLQVGGRNVTLVSYFDLGEHKHVVESALKPYSDGHYDFRRVEIAYCRLAQATQPMYVKHRGKIGFIAGILLTIPALIYRKYTAQTKSKT